jgi:hypothetical protein
MRAPLFTEFKESAALARTDTALTKQLLRHYQTSALLPARRGLCRSTCVVLAWNIQQARVVFPHDPSLIRSVISAAPCANALAAWGERQQHWIVVTEGLMKALRDAAELHAARLLTAFPAAFASLPGQRLLAATPLQGFHTMLGALLYFGAMSFVASHELGHHLAGHGAYFSGQDHRERWEVPQALERQADAIGVAAALLSVNKLMRRLFAAAALPQSDRQQQQALIAIVFTAGVLTAAARLVPAGFDFSGAHSPNAYRMLRIAATLMRPLRSLPLLDDATRKAIRRRCLEAVLGPARQVQGMQQALHAPAFQAYTSQLDAGFRLFKDNLPKRS